MANFSAIERRRLEQRHRELSKVTAFNPEAVLTTRQLGLERDKARFKLALCGRGAGKSTGRAFSFLQNGRKGNGRRLAYVTGTRRMAKNIFWPLLLQWNKEYALGWVPNWSDLTLHHPESSGVIQLSGANNVVEVDKLRGQDWHEVNIDEAQSLGRTLKTLINDAIKPRLLGPLVLTGTPGPVPAGPFFDAWKAGKERGLWSIHEWTARENPHFLAKLPEPYTNDFDAWIAGECEQRGVDINDPGIQREFFHQWAADLNALVLSFTEQNYYTDLPPLDDYIVGVDLGYDDSTAISVQGWSRTLHRSGRPYVYQVEETLLETQDVTTVGEHVKSAFARYNPICVPVDTAGLGKMIAKELSSRWDLPIVPFDKTSKTGRAKLLRSAIDRGEFLIKRGCRLDQDAKLLQWEIDPARGIKRLSEKSPDDKAFHSDIIDAAIGAYMETQAHFAEQAPEELPLEVRLREERRANRIRRNAKHVGVDIDEVDLFGETAEDVELF